jgi:phage terminase small subunit
MARLKNQRHENFCRAMLEGNNQTQAAIAAGYEPDYAKQYAWTINARADVQARLQEMNEQAMSECVMSVIERKARLSVIARATSTTKTGSITYAENIRAIAELNRMEGIGSWKNNIQQYEQPFIPISEVKIRLNVPDELLKE